MKGGRSSGASVVRSAEALAVAVTGLLLAVPAFAAPPESIEARRLRYEKEDAHKPVIGWNWDGTWLTPFAAPAYSPELGVFLTAGGLLSWRSDQESRRSGLAMSGGYGTVGAVVLSALLKASFDGDRYLLDCDVWAKDMTDHYFGVGFHAGHDTEQGDTTTRYNRVWWQLKPILLRRVHGNLYLGLTVDFNQTKATELNPKMAADPAVLRDGTNNRNYGVGPTLRFDSRDVPQDAYRGVYLQARAVAYLSTLGNHRGYEVFDVDYRHYVSIGRIGSTLTWNVATRAARGDVPWSELSMVGSPFDLRGYRWGRYRDKVTAYGIVEYRYMFSAGRDADGGVALSRHGFAGWAALGTLGNDYAHLTGVLPNVGVGYRFAVQRRLNARLDFGVGRASQAFYLNFTEAF